MWSIEFTDEFERWWLELGERTQDAIDRSVLMLARFGPSLGRPYVDTVKNSRTPNLKELRVQHAGRPYRIFFAFDPRRTAIFLIGGNKAGDRRFYQRMIPMADQLYAVYLEELKKEGLI